MLTCQLEFKYLAKITGRSQYYHAVSCALPRLILASSNMCGMKVEKGMHIMETTKMTDGLGLLPTSWNTESGKPTNSAPCFCTSCPSGSSCTQPNILLVPLLTVRMNIYSNNGS
jgi:hypothetical protein